MSYQVKQYNRDKFGTISQVKLGTGKEEVDSEHNDEIIPDLNIQDEGGIINEETGTTDSVENGATGKDEEDDSNKIETVIILVKKQGRKSSSQVTSAGKYMVLIKQIEPHQATSYKIFSSQSIHKAQDSFKATQCIMQPLSVVPLSVKLLEVLFLPKVKSIDDLAPILAKYIHANKETITEKEWKALVGIDAIGQHACTVKDIELLMLLISNGASPLIQDPQTQNNLLHVAVRCDFKCFKALLKYMEKSLSTDVFMTHINQTNLDAILSLQMKQPLVKKRMRIFSSSNSLDLDLDVTPTQSPRTSEDKKGAGVTPLMIACQECNTPIVHCLLVMGADPNVCDPLFRTTALHIAAMMAHKDIVKLLLAFEANVNVEDSEGKTPLDIIKHSLQKPQLRECFLAMQKVECLRLKLASRHDLLYGIGNETSTEENREISMNEMPSVVMNDCSIKDDAFLLSFDGGGTKVYTGILILHTIEKKMRILSKDPSLRVVKYFNWVAGTSVGGMVTLMMTHGGHAPIDVLKVIAFHKNEIFPGRRIYNPDGLVKYSKMYAGDSDVRDITEPRVLVTTAQADISPPRLVLITNYREDPGNGRQWKAWEAARAASAAPTYYPSFEGKYVDGGILAINPTLHAMSDIHRYDDRKLKFVLSLGTGVSPEQPIDSIDLVIPKVSASLVADLKANFKFLSGFLNMLTANLSNLDGPATQAQDWCEAIGAEYHRLSAPISKVLDLDTIDDSDIALLIYDAYIHCLECDDELQDIAVTLLKHGPMR